jgi:hypothetical protein
MSVTQTCSIFTGPAENVDSLYVWIVIWTEKIKLLEDGEQKVEDLLQVITENFLCKSLLVWTSAGRIFTTVSSGILDHLTEF